MEQIKIIVEVLTCLVACIAFCLAWKEYMSRKRTEYHKLFSQLNRRYEKNESMQAVVKYLRDKEPEGDYISLYQLEVFLRFFEELGLYMETNSLNAADVDTFFGYYLRQLYKTPKGQKLIQGLGSEEQELKLLQVVKQKLNIH